MSPSGVKVELRFASSGIEGEIVDSATPIDFDGAGSVPVANAEELLAMKVLSMTDTRLQIESTPSACCSSRPTSTSAACANLARITDRGYAREQNLEAKLASVLKDVGLSLR